MIQLSVIVAVQKETNVISSNNNIPWHNPSDMTMFKKITSYTDIHSKNNILLCGYNTYLTLPKYFKEQDKVSNLNRGNRILIVMTKNHKKN